MLVLKVFNEKHERTIPSKIQLQKTIWILDYWEREIHQFRLQQKKREIKPQTRRTTYI